MTSKIASLFADLGGWSEPRRIPGNPFRLVNRLNDPATEAEVQSAWEGQSLPAEVLDIWMAVRSAELFLDVDFGQWGLRILDPATSAGRTAQESTDRPVDSESGDVVLGTFAGDQELVVVERGGAVRIALPLDGRTSWPYAADSLLDFLTRYVAANGDKYWEATGRASDIAAR